MGTGGWNGAAASEMVSSDHIGGVPRWGYVGKIKKIGGHHDFTQGIIEVVTPSTRINAALEDENSSPTGDHRCIIEEGFGKEGSLATI